MRTGVFPGMTAEEYFSLPAINKSSLDDFEQSPLHYWARHLDPEREKEKQSEAMKLGSAVHTAILEPDTFESIYAMFDGDRRTKEGKAAYAELEAQAREIMSAKQWEQATKISEAMRSHPNYEIFLTGGRAELAVVSKCPKTGLYRKARIDYLAENGTVLVDLKKTRDASPRGFAKACGEYNYHRQAAWYLDVARDAGIDAKLFVFVAIEDAPPYAVAFYHASGEMISQGREENERLIAAYSSCVERNEWPGYSDEVLEINLPKWRREVTSSAELETF